MREPEKPLTYSRADWIADTTWMAQHQETEHYNGSAILAYFERKYGPTAQWHYLRAIGALRYYLRHVQDFNESHFGIAAKQGGVMGRSLLLALLHVFNGAADDQMDHEWNVGDLKALAEKLKEA